MRMIKRVRMNQIAGALVSPCRETPAIVMGVKAVRARYIVLDCVTDWATKEKQ